MTFVLCNVCLRFFILVICTIKVRHLKGRNGRGTEGGRGRGMERLRKGGGRGEGGGR